MRNPLTTLCLIAILGLATPAKAQQPLDPGSTYEFCFTPGQDCQGKIVAFILGAKHSIAMMAYSFTDREIANALITKHKAGLPVFLDVDKNQRTERNSVVPQIAAAGIPVRVDNRPQIAHNKVLIRDTGTPDAALETGSYNFSYGAERRNAENALFIFNAPLAVSQYAAYFNEQFQASEDWQ